MGVVCPSESPSEAETRAAEARASEGAAPRRSVCRARRGGEWDGQRRAGVEARAGARALTARENSFPRSMFGAATEAPRADRAGSLARGHPRGDARGGARQALDARQTFARETRACRAERAYLSHRPQTRVPRAERSHRGAQRENRQHPHGLHHRTGGERPRERAEHAARARASSGVRRLAGIARGGNAEPRVVEAVEGRRRRGAVPRVSLLRAPRQDGRGRVRSRVHLPTRQSTSEGTVPTAVPEPKPPDDRPRPPDFPET